MPIYSFDGTSPSSTYKDSPIASPVAIILSPLSHRVSSFSIEFEHDMVVLASFNQRPLNLGIGPKNIPRRSRADTLDRTPSDLCAEPSGAVNIPLTHRQGNPRVGEWERIRHPLSTCHYYYHPRLRITTNLDLELQNEGDFLEQTVSKLPAGIDCEWYHGRRGNWIYINHTKEIAQFVLPLFVTEEQLDKDPPPGQEDVFKNKYWNFVRAHPFHLRRKPSQSAVACAIDALTLISAHHIFDPRSPILPFSKTHCQDLREMLISAGAHQDGAAGAAETTVFDYRTYVVASVLEKIYAQRYWRGAYQPEGCQEAQSTSSKHSGHVFKKCKTFLLDASVRIVFVLLLWVPVHYEKQIERACRVRIDKQVPRHVWKEIIDKLKNEWSLFILIAAVLWASTVAGLAVPGIDPWNRLFTGLAAECAFTCIAIGMALLWQYVGTLEEDGNMRELYFRHDPRRVACLQALPLAVLLWGLLCFAVAGFLFPFLRKDEPPNIPSPDAKIATMVIASTAFLLLAIAVVTVVFDVISTKRKAAQAEDQVAKISAAPYMAAVIPANSPVDAGPASTHDQKAATDQIQGGGYTAATSQLGNRLDGAGNESAVRSESPDNYDHV